MPGGWYGEPAELVEWAGLRFSALGRGGPEAEGGGPPANGYGPNWWGGGMWCGGGYWPERHLS